MKEKRTQEKRTRFRNQIKDRLKKLVLKVISAGFLTWVSVLIVYVSLKQTIDSQFLSFTVFMVLGKSAYHYFKQKDGIE